MGQTNRELSIRISEHILVSETGMRSPVDRHFNSADRGVWFMGIETVKPLLNRGGDKEKKRPQREAYWIHYL